MTYNVFGGTLSLTLSVTFMTAGEAGMCRCTPHIHNMYLPLKAT